VNDASYVQRRVRAKQAFFEHLVLQGQLSDQLLELLVLLSQSLDLIVVGFPICVSYKARFPGLEKVLAPAIVKVFVNTLTSA
jgi:hypothetical protein